jgi:thiamine biosynthesis protein ThiI
MSNVILVRFGEVFLKKGNRPWFLRVLKENLKRNVRAAAGLEKFYVTAFHGRYEVHSPDLRDLTDSELAKAVDAAKSTFGVVSISPARRVELSYEAIESAALDAVKAALDASPIRNFRIEASRAFKGFPVSSPELNRRVGAAVVERFGLPGKMVGWDLNVGIEVYEHGAYVFGQRIPGPGGLPVGTSGKAVLLLSGGIDSPVAGYMMAKRGCQIFPVHFHSVPYTSKRAMEKVRDLHAVLSRYTGGGRVTLIRLTDVQEYLRDHVPPEKLVLFYRRSMVRLATRVAQVTRARALVTGESLAQVASQTLDNMSVIGEATKLILLRPLVGMDKVETMDLARRIGTYDISVRPHDDCCSLFLPPHPDTHGNVDDIKGIEAGLPELAALEDAAFASREVQAEEPVDP